MRYDFRLGKDLSASHAHEMPSAGRTKEGPAGAAAEAGIVRRPYP